MLPLSEASGHDPSRLGAHTLFICLFFFPSIQQISKLFWCRKIQNHHKKFLGDKKRRILSHFTLLRVHAHNMSLSTVQRTQKLSGNKRSGRICLAIREKNRRRSRMAFCKQQENQRICSLVVSYVQHCGVLYYGHHARQRVRDPVLEGLQHNFILKCNSSFSIHAVHERGHEYQRP